MYEEMQKRHKRSLQKLFANKIKALAMVTRNNMVFLLGNCEELICSIAMSWDEGSASYELKATADVFARSASIIALI